MDKIISFIILAYNVEQYLHKCLDSFICLPVLGQIEVIVVDDGSVDSTGEIADGYAKRYPHVFKVIHKENGGHGSGINVGSRQACGKYLKAIDADDWVLTENLPDFVAQLAVCDADVVLTPFHMVDMTTGEQAAKHMQGWNAATVQIEDILNNWKIFEECCVFHGITYRTDFYTNCGHDLPEHIFYEDQEYNTIPFCRAESIAVFQMYIYQYLIGNAQQSISYANQAKRIDHLERVVCDLAEYYLESTDLTQSARKYLFRKLESVSLIYFATACIYESDKRKGRNKGKAFANELRNKMPEVYRNIRNKYYLYLTMNYIRISPDRYQSLVQSGKYRRIKNTVKCLLKRK